MQFAVDKKDMLLNTPAVETGLHDIRLTEQTVPSTNIIHVVVLFLLLLHVVTGVFEGSPFVWLLCVCCCVLCDVVCWLVG